MSEYYVYLCIALYAINSAMLKENAESIDFTGFDGDCHSMQGLR